jgi:large subunit ribosomal protein L29
MKPNEIRNMSPDERSQKLAEMQEAFFNLRFQHETGQLENPQKLKQAKRDIARIKTVMREMELNPNPTSES